jgi:P pilus assembly chaperone PapD
MTTPRPPHCFTASIHLLRVFVLGLFAAVAGEGAHAQASPGDLLVAPTRIVLEGRQRSAEITLVNTGSSTATYRITFVNLRMNETGATTEIETSGAEPGERFADAMIRYSPRQVILEPKVAQTVRLQLRLPADLEPGEYRSHLLFRAIPSAAAVPAADAAPETTEPKEGFSVQLTAIFGISIPVIVRHGDTAGTATLSELDLVPPTGADATPTLRFRIRRTGNRSVYGNLTATFVPAGGKPTVVAKVNGLAVYTPNLTRSAGLTLHAPPGVFLVNGRLHLAYTLQEKGNETIAEADLLVP